MDEYRKPYILFLAGVFMNDGNDNIALESLGLADKSEQINIGDEEQSGDAQNEDDSILITGMNDKENQNYTEIPKYYTNRKTWPTGTNILCWCCHNRVRGIPWFVPLAWIKKVFVDDLEIENQIYFNTEGKEDEVSEISDNAILTNGQTVHEGKVFIPHGIFCGPMCVKRYIKYVKDPKISNIWETIKLLSVLYKEITGGICNEIPEAEDPHIMAKFSGSGGISEKQYIDLNDATAAKFKLILKINN
jgi:hypothetical protein